MRSNCRWQDAVESGEEALLIVKTTADGLDALVAHVEEHHPYDTPEVIALPIDAGAAPYLAWIRDSVG